MPADLQDGDLVVQTAGTLTGVSGATDFIKVGLVSAVFSSRRRHTCYAAGLGIPAEPLFRSVSERFNLLCGIRDFKNGFKGGMKLHV